MSVRLLKGLFLFQHTGKQSELFNSLPPQSVELHSAATKPSQQLCYSPHILLCGWADSLTLGIRCLELANEPCRGTEKERQRSQKS